MFVEHLDIIGVSFESFRKFLEVLYLDSSDDSSLDMSYVLHNRYGVSIEEDSRLPWWLTRIGYETDSTDGIFISQDKYVADILKKFDFATVKTASTPIETNKVLLKDEEAADVDVHLYISMIRSLMYLTTSRLNIISHHRCFLDDTSLIHIESRKSPTAELFDVDSRRISIVTVNTEKYHSDVLARSQG
ncbi:hypothetical protein Tco_0581784 [Tanacetum coccineum]